jgi:hypothetical protein
MFRIAHAIDREYRLYVFLAVGSLIGAFAVAGYVWKESRITFGMVTGIVALMGIVWLAFNMIFSRVAW